jgi:hypothetical protein
LSGYINEAKEVKTGFQLPLGETTAKGISYILPQKKGK